jgi:hypothetical protein
LGLIVRCLFHRMKISIARPCGRCAPKTCIFSAEGKCVRELTVQTISSSASASASVLIAPSGAATPIAPKRASSSASDSRESGETSSGSSDSSDDGSSSSSSSSRSRSRSNNNSNRTDRTSHRQRSPTVSPDPDAHFAELLRATADERTKSGGSHSLPTHEKNASRKRASEKKIGRSRPLAVVKRKRVNPASAAAATPAPSRAVVSNRTPASSLTVSIEHPVSSSDSVRRVSRAAAPGPTHSSAGHRSKSPRRRSPANSGRRSRSPHITRSDRAVGGSQPLLPSSSSAVRGDRYPERAVRPPSPRRLEGQTRVPITAGRPSPSGSSRIPSPRRVDRRQRSPTPPPPIRPLGRSRPPSPRPPARQPSPRPPARQPSPRPPARQPSPPQLRRKRSPPRSNVRRFVITRRDRSSYMAGDVRDNRPGRLPSPPRRSSPPSRGQDSMRRKRENDETSLARNRSRSPAREQERSEPKPDHRSEPKSERIIPKSERSEPKPERSEPKSERSEREQNETLDPPPPPKSPLPVRRSTSPRASPPRAPSPKEDAEGTAIETNDDETNMSASVAKVDLPSTSNNGLEEDEDSMPKELAYTCV